MRHPIALIHVLLAFLVWGMGGGAWLAAQDLSVQVTLTIANTAPLVDLNGNPAGPDFQTAFILGGVSVPLVDANALTVSDSTNGILTQGQARLINRPDGAQEWLDVTVAGGITTSYDADTGILTLNGPATVAAFQTVLRSLIYRNTAPIPDSTERSIQVTVSDGSLTSPVATSTVAMVLPAPGLVVLPASTAGQPLITDENGALQLVAIRLGTIPTGTVQVLLTDPAPGEVVLSTTALTFTPATWNQIQTVLITGLPDGRVDDDQLVAIAVTINAPGTDYHAVTHPDIVVLNRNRDIPGLAVTAGSTGTMVQEGGAGDTLGVALTARPAGPVTVTIGGGGGQVATSPASLTFTSATWNQPQSFQLTAIDDRLVNGTRLVTMLISAAGSGYAGVSATAPVTVRDNDVAGVEVTPTSGLVTSKGGQQAHVHFRLKSQPSADVDVPLSSANPGIGTVTPASLTFTPADWNSYQTATLDGVQDGTVNGDQPWTMVTGPTTSADASYNGINPPDAAVINRDTNHVALLVTPGAVVVNQGGATAHLQVRLASRPSGPVTVVLTSSDPVEAMVVPAGLVFTGGAGGTWNTAQDAVVTGLASGSIGNQSFIVECRASSTDPAYNALAPVVVNGINQDINRPTVLLDLPPAMALTEGDAGTVSYGVRLSTDPGASTIIVNPTSFDGQLAVLTGSTLTFDHGNFATPQTVTVAAVDDAIAEGPHSGQIQHQVIGSYDSITLTIPLTDNDQAGIITTPPAGLTTTEAGGTASFTVRLTSQPTAPVTIPLASSDASQGTVSPASLTFTAAGGAAWNLPQTVTVTGVDGNHFDDGDVPYQVLIGPAASGDALYDRSSGSPVGLVNRRVDHPPTIDAIADLHLQENAGTQVVMLGGISDGQPGENQVVTVAVTGNSNPALTGPLAVAYTSPATTGSISFTPTANRFGTASITVQVGDGITTVTRPFQVQVAWVNQSPVVLRHTPLVVGYGGTVTFQGMNADPSDPGQLAASDVETATAALVYRVVLAPAGGHLARGGATLTTGGGFTQADIDAGTVTYAHAGAAGDSDGFVVRVEDGDGGQSDPVVVAVTITRSPPVLDLHALPGATWTEDGPPLTIVPAAEVSDADSATFDTGHCTVTEVGGGQTGDRLGLRDDGDGAGLIGVSGSTVSWGGVPVATMSGGSHADPLVITFNGQATPAAVQAALRAITFSHLTQVPSTSPRILRVELVDDHGDAATPQTCTITVQAVNNPPVMGSLTLATTSGAAVAGRLAASDPDGPALSFAVLRGPGLGRISAFDAATGAFTYTPYGTAQGSDTFLVRASDSIAASAVATVTIVITGPATDQRLWIASDPPLEAQAGERLRWSLRVDATALAAPDLRFALDEAPAGMLLAADAATGTAVITWPTVAGNGHVRLRIRVWDAGSLVCEVQPVCILVHPLPTQIGAIAPAPDGEGMPLAGRGSTTAMGLTAIMAVALLGMVLRSMARQPGTSGLRPVTEAVRMVRRQRKDGP